MGHDITHGFGDVLELHLFNIGKTPITMVVLLEIIVATLALFLFSSWLQRRALIRLLSHSHLDQGLRETIGTLVRYTVLIFGFVIIMQTIGIDLTALGVLAGAVGVGVGFGLQNVFSNFISGLIVMFERPIKIGDHIELPGIDGDVVEIGARATRVMTAHRSIIIVPNQKLITESVTNWSIQTNLTSVLIAIKANSEAGALAIAKLLKETALEVENVVRSPEPVANLLSQDAGGYSFELQAWVNCDAQCRARVVTAMHTAIRSKLSAAGAKLS